MCTFKLLTSSRPRTYHLTHQWICEELSPDDTVRLGQRLAEVEYCLKREKQRVSANIAQHECRNITHYVLPYAKLWWGASRRTCSRTPLVQWRLM